MSERRGILAGGNFIRDRVKMIDVYPAQECLANIISESASNGGGPYNLLIDLSILKAPFPLAAVGLVGDDADGSAVIDHCQSHGINVSQLRLRSGVSTSYTDVMTVQSTGRRTFFHQRGANALLDVADFDFERSDAKIFHLGYLLLLDTLDSPDPQFGTRAARVLANAKAAGFVTTIDLVSEESCRFDAIVAPALKHVDVCLMNEIEAERTTGITIRQDGAVHKEALIKAGRCLLEMGVSTAAVIHSAELAACVTPVGEHWQPSLPTPPGWLVSSVGAGDAFAAGFLYGLHENQPWDVCLHQAAATAALSLRHPSTSEGLAPLEEVLAITSRW